MEARKGLGERIARERRRRGMSQLVLSGLIGRSESWLSQVERGQRRADSHSVLTILAEILGLTVDELTASETADTMKRYRAAEKIRQAMMGYDGLATVIYNDRTETTRENLEWLRRGLQTVNDLYQATKYEEAGRRLPGLIVATEIASRNAPPGGRRPFQALRAMTYHATAATLSRVGEAELAWTAADRSLAAAEEADNPILAAVSAYRLGYVLIRLGESDKALQIAEQATEALTRSSERADPQRLSVTGGLHLVAVTAAATQLDRATVDTHLAHARDLAHLVGGDRNDFWTAFGPTNVTIHGLTAAVTFADAKQAINEGESVDVSRLSPGLLGRRAQVHLDLARAYAILRKDAAAVNMLLEAERISPELIRYDRRTSDLLTQLIQREHQVSTPELRGLAHRAGVI
ncbi:helix-turn-helix domain-containing protein [Sphaerisporangium aureirubrum]|uniref:Helix-turn-helix domain-containing protein n=1 Tax=Sphaerisporangium aureirubrum TaxID=1544736 RepID=A0ABW1NWJ7_9ACTN